MTIGARRAGAGVVMTVALRHVAHRKWLTYGTVTPFLGYPGDPPLTTYTAYHGSLTLTTSNLTGSAVVPGANTAWPQLATVILFPKYSADCGGALYSNSAYTDANTAKLRLKFRRNSGQIMVTDMGRLSGGTWKLTVTVSSPAGVQRETKHVTTHVFSYSPGAPFFTTQVRGFTNLRNFTKVTVVATKSNDRYWMTLTRTP